MITAHRLRARRTDSILPAARWPYPTDKAAPLAGRPGSEAIRRPDSSRAGIAGGVHRCGRDRGPGAGVCCPAGEPWTCVGSWFGFFALPVRREAASRSHSGVVFAGTGTGCGPQSDV